MTGPPLAERLELNDLFVRVLWAIDTRDLHMFTGCFWHDARMTLALPGSTVAVGVGEIGALLAALDDGDGRQHRETGRIYLPTDEERPGRWRAAATTFTTQRDVTAGAVDLVSAGYARDLVVRRDGEWRIQERRLAHWPQDARRVLTDWSDFP